MRIYEGYFNDVEQDESGLASDIEQTVKSGNEDNPDNYNTHLIIEIGFSFSAFSDVKKEAEYPKVYKLINRIKYCMEQCPLIDVVSGYMPINFPSYKNYYEQKNRIDVYDDKLTFFCDSDLVSLTSGMHYAINVFCNMNIDSYKKLIQFIRYVQNMKGYSYQSGIYIVRFAIRKYNGKVLNYSHTLDSESKAMFSVKERAVRQQNWSNNSRFDTIRKFLETCEKLYGVGSIDRVCQYLDVNLWQLIVDKIISNMRGNSRRKRIGIYNKKKNFNLDAFIDFAWPLAKEELIIFDIVRQQVRQGFKSTFDKESFKDWVRSSDTDIISYFYRMTYSGKDVIIHIFTKPEISDIECFYVLFQEMDTHQSIYSDYNSVNIADFITPLIALGARVDTILKNYDVRRYFNGSFDKRDECKEMIEKNLKGGVK